MKKLFFFLAITAFVFSSCKKKDKDCSLSEANLVGSYKVASIKYKASATSSEEDVTNQVDACERDDVFTFNADHTLVYTDAGAACSPNGDDSGNWSLAGSVLSIDSDAGTVEEFSCKGFTLFANDILTSGDKVSVNYTKQ